jgi:hypothetical protein
MEDLIKQAFLHIEVIGPHVAEGHYDLVGPNGDIILPQVWETVVEPDWTITMHMWPIPEKPKEPEPSAKEEAAPPPAKPDPSPAAAPEPKKKPEGMSRDDLAEKCARRGPPVPFVCNVLTISFNSCQETGAQRRRRWICEVDDGWPPSSQGSQGCKGREEARTRSRSSMRCIAVYVG